MLIDRIAQASFDLLETPGFAPAPVNVSQKKRHGGVDGLVREDELSLDRLS